MESNGNEEQDREKKREGESKITREGARERALERGRRKGGKGLVEGKRKRGRIECAQERENVGE